MVTKEDSVIDVCKAARSIACAAAASLLLAIPCSAQVTPAAGYIPPDDTPGIRVGTTIYMDYTVQDQPRITDAAGNSVTSNSFNVTRAYINVTGNINHYIAFRVTPDITRESGVGSSLNGSYTFRLKYAFVIFNLDDWMTKGSWARFGLQQTPYVDYAEGIYRYRFQGTIFSEREGFLTSSDNGASFHYNFAQNYGDIHVGVYNGEGYSRAEGNNTKAFQIRGTVRPLHTHSVLRGLRVTGFYDGDAYVNHAPRHRADFSVTFEHDYLNAGYEYLDTKDQTLPTASVANGKGWSFWATPRSPKGFEGLLRFDHFEPNDTTSQKRDRQIIGVAYWFPHQGNVSTALLLDYDNATFKNFTPSQPTQRKIAVHGLVNF
jgi:hypothetical protein